MNKHLYLIRNRRIWELSDNGMTPGEIAKIFALTRRAVYYVLAKRPDFSPRKPFQLVISGNGIAPDVDDVVHAESREQAVELFFGKYGKYGWELDTIERCVEEIKQ